SRASGDKRYAGGDADDGYAAEICRRGRIFAGWLSDAVTGLRSVLRGDGADAEAVAAEDFERSSSACVAAWAAVDAAKCLRAGAREVPAGAQQQGRRIDQDRS